jgi:hypothetical protein
VFPKLVSISNSAGVVKYFFMALFALPLSFWANYSLRFHERFVATAWCPASRGGVKGVHRQTLDAVPGSP